MKQASVEKKVPAATASAEKPPSVKRVISDSGSKENSPPLHDSEPHSLEEVRTMTGITSLGLSALRPIMCNIPSTFVCECSVGKVI